MKKLIFIFVLIPMLLFPQKKDYKTYDKAVKLYHQKNYAKSIKLSLKLVSECPDWTKPYLLLAKIYTAKGEVDLSATYLLKVFDENNPKHVKGIEQIGHLFYTNAKYNEARYYFKAAWKSDSLNCKKKIPLLIKNCDFAIQAIQNPVDFNTYNMGENINSKYAEYLPTISANNKLFFITRRLRYDDGSTNEDFFISTKNENFLVSRYSSKFIVFVETPTSSNSKIFSPP